MGAAEDRSAAHETVLYVTAEVLRELAILTQPYIPAAAEKLLDLLAVPADGRNFAALGSSGRIEPATALAGPDAGLSALCGGRRRAGGFVMPLAIVDSHCHLDFEQFAGQIDEIIARARDNGVLLMVTISTRVKRFDEIRAIAEAHEEIWCTVGTHPHNAEEETDVTVEELVRSAAHPKVVGIGEAGLDYHYDLARAMFRRRLSHPHRGGARDRPAARHPCPRGR